MINSNKTNDHQGTESPALEAALVPLCALGSIRNIVCLIPEFYNLVGLECRLGEALDQVDFSVLVTKRHASMLSGRSKNKRWEDLAQSDTRWAIVRDFACEWEKLGSTLHHWIPFLFLEVDIDPELDSVPVPSIFAALDSPLVRPDSDYPEERMPEIRAFYQSAKILSGRKLEKDLVEEIKLCFSSLPPDGRVLHLGKMIGRGHQGIRMSANMQPDEIITFLKNTNRPVSLLQIGSIIERYKRYMPVEGVQIDFDLGCGISPNLGIGFSFNDSKTRENFFDCLIQRGIAAPVKGELLKNDTSQRTLYHVKLSCVPQKQETAKAYLGVPSCLIYR
ncbi:hypothetical protein KJ966_11145 [bacterium]|nr:hypothetical protein [bacterium]